jgi:hypothetical protein
MARGKKEGARKYTLRFMDDVIDEVREVAAEESRTLTAQIEVFLRFALQERKKAKAKETEPGQRIPALLLAA